MRPTPGLLHTSQERKLRSGGSAAFGLGPASGNYSSGKDGARSTVDDFARTNTAYAGVAAAAMARVRARFQGFEDGEGTAVGGRRGLGALEVPSS